jgi:hypothetical protein
MLTRTMLFNDQTLEQRERSTLAPYAQFSSDTRGTPNPDPPGAPPTNGTGIV